MSKSDKTEISKQIAASIKNFTAHAMGDPSRWKKEFIEMPEFIREKAEMISAHFLLPDGAKIIDMGCDTGEVAYVLAQLNPRATVIGVDNNPDSIEFARTNYKLSNLSYRNADIRIPDFEDNSIDAIVNSNMLHGIYSHAGYNPDVIGELLEKQVRKLKPGGTMLIRDYMMPNEKEMVLLEVLNTKSTGRDPTQLSDGDLLIRFSQTARPLLTGGSEGFHIEEISPRRVNTRLFKLPHKWALEFIYRKDLRERWSDEISEEYTFFTWQDYTREFTKVGMRVVYTAPYWNPWIIKNHFKGHFQIYNDDYKALSWPATNYFIVAQKLADKQSLLLEERRPSLQPVGDLQVIAVRDKKSGVIHELVKRPGEFCDVVPYRITSDNRLVVYVRSGYPRPIINAGSRGRFNLDGKKWSGHLIEPISMETVSMTDDVEKNRQMIFGHVRDYASLRPKSEESWFVGDTYYPAPDQIDEAIEAVYVEVENPYKHVWPIEADKDAPFTELGTITELDANSILVASQVGLLPEPRLELHVIDLMHRYKIPFPKWIGEKMPKMVRQSVRVHHPDEILKEAEKTTFVQERKDAAVHLKPVKAVFIEEGKVGKQTRGLSAQDIEYIVTDDGIDNIALVLPITRDWDNNLLVALDPKVMPVPNRLGGDGAMLNAPSFPLPRDCRTIEDAKEFIAGKFRVPAERVSQLGASFFTHVGVMPQRVYVFTVASAQPADTTRIMKYALMDALITWVWAQRHYKIETSTLKAIARTHIRMGGMRHDMQMVVTPELAKVQPFKLSTEKVAVEAINAGYSSAPSRILGQRGPQTQAREAPSERAITSLQKHISQVRSGGSRAPAGGTLSKTYDKSRVLVRGNPSFARMEENVKVIKDALGKSGTQKTSMEAHLNVAGLGGEAGAGGKKGGGTGAFGGAAGGRGGGAGAGGGKK